MIHEDCGVSLCAACVQLVSPLCFTGFFFLEPVLFYSHTNIPDALSKSPRQLRLQLRTSADPAFAYSQRDFSSRILKQEHHQFQQVLRKLNRFFIAAPNSRDRTFHFVQGYAE